MSPAEAGAPLPWRLQTRRRQDEGSGASFIRPRSLLNQHPSFAVKIDVLLGSLRAPPGLSGPCALAAAAAPTCDSPSLPITAKNKLCPLIRLFTQRCPTQSVMYLLIPSKGFRRSHAKASKTKILPHFFPIYFLLVGD